VRFVLFVAILRISAINDRQHEKILSATKYTKNNYEDLLGFFCALCAFVAILRISAINDRLRIGHLDPG